MTTTDCQALVDALNLAATLPPVGSPACARGLAALARVQAGTKLRDLGTSVVILVEDGCMVRVSYTDRTTYHVELYTETVE